MDLFSILKKFRSDLGEFIKKYPSPASFAAEKLKMPSFAKTMADPSVGLKIARDFVVRPAARGVGSATLSAMGQGKISPTEIPQGGAGQWATRQLFGDRELGPLQQYAETEYGDVPFLGKYAQQAGQSKYALPIGLGLAALDVTPFGFGKKGAAKGVAKGLTKAERLLKEVPEAAKINISNYAEPGRALVKKLPKINDYSDSLIKVSDYSKKVKTGTKWVKDKFGKFQGRKKTALGGLAGIEPYEDENGEVKYKFNPGRAAIGLGVMTLYGGVKGVRNLPKPEVAQDLTPTITDMANQGTFTRMKGFWEKVSGRLPYLRNLGPKGREFARIVNETNAEKNFYEGTVGQGLAKFHKKWKATEETMKSLERGNDSQLAREFSQIRDLIYNEANRFGYQAKELGAPSANQIRLPMELGPTKPMGYVKNWVPRIYDWGNTKKVNEVIQEMATNRGITTKEARSLLSKTSNAEKKLEDVIRNPASDTMEFITRQKNASLEYSRVDIPPELEKLRVWDPRVIYMRMVEMAGDIGKSKMVGRYNEKLMEASDFITDETGRKYVMDAVKHLNGVGGKSTRWLDRVSDGIRKWETLFKLQGGTSLQNVAQNVYNAGYAGIPTTVKSMLKVAVTPRKSAGEALRKGLIDAKYALPQKGIDNFYRNVFKAGLFPQTETFNKMVSSAAAIPTVQNKWNRALKALNKGNVKAFKRMGKELEDVFLVPVQKVLKTQKGRLSAEQLRRAEWGLAHRTQFLEMAMEMPEMLTRKGTVGMAFQFKTYIWNQPKLIAESVAEAASGRPRKLANQLVMAYALGYPLSKAKDAIFGTEESKDPLSVLKFGMGGTGLGILESIWTSAKYGSTVGMIAGPGPSDIGSFVEGVYQAYTTGKTRNLEKLLIGNVPGFGYGLRKAFYPSQKSGSSSASPQYLAPKSSTGGKIDMGTIYKKYRR